MKLSTAMESRALSKKPPLQTWQVAYQEPCLMRPGWKPKTEVNINAYTKPVKVQGHEQAKESTVKKVNQMIADRAKAKQFDQLAKVVKVKKKFTTPDVEEILGVSTHSAKHKVRYWHNTLKAIRNTGFVPGTNKVIWERV